MTTVTEKRIQKPRDLSISFEGHVCRLGGANKPRYCFILPMEVTPVVGKRTRYEVTLKPLGSLPRVRIG